MYHVCLVITGQTAVALFGESKQQRRSWSVTSKVGTTFRVYREAQSNPKIGQTAAPGVVDEALRTKASLSPIFDCDSY